MAIVQEQFNAVPVAANSTRIVVPAMSGGQAMIGGFLCTAAGNFKLAKGADGAGADIVANFAMTVGTFYPIPATIAEPCAIVTSGGCAGTCFML